MKYITVEDVLQLIARDKPAHYEASRNESYEEWLLRTVNAAIAGLGDGSNPVFTPEEWARLKAQCWERLDDEGSAQPGVPKILTRLPAISQGLTARRR
ncbi:hypothetical protein [Pseudoduganella violacea]|uniref:Uncharacterized protein n=1 Tax=Pseudoduganella violacea TaxID=1715466 RepID=A0A7W5BA04_9BURK|nr:hypothetical protein [Pseudoduganella violacea]MBB3119266.1 hypothetical protein [Pseudoduganella violacea]